MPKKYEGIRDKVVKEGHPLKEAKSIAAATYIKEAGPRGSPARSRDESNSPRRSVNFAALSAVQEKDTARINFCGGSSLRIANLRGSRKPTLHHTQTQSRKGTPLVFRKLLALNPDAGIPLNPSSLSSVKII